LVGKKVCVTDPREPTSRLRVVSFHDPTGVLEHVESRPDVVHPRFAPIADLTHGGAAGYEVLLSLGQERAAAPSDWSHEVHPSAAGRLESILLAAALNERDRLPHGAYLAVNVSAAALRSDEVAAVLGDAGELDHVVLIVTEDAAEDVDGRVADAIEYVRDAAGLVCVDETGSGYASFRHVLDLRPDFVRVGTTFVAGIDGDPAKGAVLEAVVSLATRTGAQVIAGGIPGRPELSALRRMGVQLGMGTLFGPPAAGMGPLSRGATEAIKQASPPVEPGETVAALIEARPPLPWGSSIEQVADAFLEDPLNDVIVLVDERSRPLALAERAALMRGEPYERPVMRISPTSPQKAVARRAAARPWMERFNPLVACDRLGVYLGLVRVEQLLDALAQE
jgi:EAL domain-containing protein (putative c-di-GMP-specific phosphodiesterase class I)